MSPALDHCSIGGGPGTIDKPAQTRTIGRSAGELAWGQGAMDESGERGTTSFGELLRGHRGRRGLTQEELAERSGLSVQGISALERGARRAPRTTTIEVLAGAMKL